ncbi:MAG TPA: EAL domain-containing protein [Burkholderiaceae bacterium]|nr:EAL domain-containing protein [Burkholderiaceae bacterium]
MRPQLLDCIDGFAYQACGPARDRLDSVSAGFSALTGHSADRFTGDAGERYALLIDPQDQARVADAIAQAIATRQRFDVEYRLLRADGERRWVRERGIAVADATDAPPRIDGWVEDADAARRALDAAREALQRERRFIEHAAEGIFETTPDGRFLRANPALARLLGYPDPASLIERLNVARHRFYVDPQARDELLRRLEHDGRVEQFEARVRRADGRVLWISENVHAVRDDKGRLSRLQGTLVDISERKAQELRSATGALHDPLTGLPNRALLRDRLQHAIEAAQRRRRLLAVIVFDVDAAAATAPPLRPAVRDDLLRAAAARLPDCVRASDTVARYGAERFVLLLQDDVDAASIAQVTQRVLAELARPIPVDAHEATPRCSLGISVYPDHGTDADTLLRHAEFAMHEARRAGPNTFRMYTAELTHAVAQRVNLAGRLRQALQRDEFELHFQPKLMLVGARPVGAEALLRWKPAQGPGAPPSQFIPVAEDSGLIETLGQWVIDAACTAAVQWQRELGVPLPVSANVSARQFRHTDLVATVRRALAQSGLAPQSLEIEITESCLADDSGRFLRVLGELKALGVALSIDDFGTGYSSMAYLMHLPIDRLKIDQAFVAGLAADAPNDAILRAIVGLGHSLGLKVLAEGVETERQRQRLAALGCDEAQGYLFSPPVPLPRITAYLRDTLARAPDQAL